MDIKTFEVDAKAGITKLVGAVEAFFAAHPDLESDAANTLRDTANTVAPIAQHVVDQAAPPSVADAIDAAIAKEQADAQTAAEKLQAESQTRIAALEAAKQNALAAEAAKASGDGQAAA